MFSLRFFWRFSLKIPLLLLTCIRASIDDEDQAEIEQRERAHAASQAKQGELKQEYEAMLETQRQLRRIEAEENERKLRKFLASDPEFCSASPSQIRVRSEMFVAGEEEAAVVERLRREEEKLRKKLEQEQKDAEFARKLAGQLEGASSTGNLGENSRSSDGASSATRFANPSRKRSLHDNSQAGFSPRRKTFSEKPPLVVEKQRSVHALPRTARPTLSERNILSPTRSRDNVPAAAPRKRMAREPASSDIVDLVDLCSPTSEEAGVATPTTSATSEARSSKSRVQRPVQRWSSSPFGKSAGSEPSAPARTQRQKEHFNRAVPGNTLHRFLRLSQSPTNP